MLIYGFKPLAWYKLQAWRFPWESLKDENLNFKYLVVWQEFNLSSISSKVIVLDFWNSFTQFWTFKNANFNNVFQFIASSDALQNREFCWWKKLRRMVSLEQSYGKKNQFWMKSQWVKLRNVSAKWIVWGFSSFILCWRIYLSVNFRHISLKW